MASRYQHSNQRHAQSKTNAMLMGLGGGSFDGYSRTVPTNSIAAKPTPAKPRRGEPDCIVRLRKKLTSRGTHGIHSLGRLFRVMDDDGNKKLTVSELKYGLVDLGVRMNDIEVDELFRYLDRDGNGSINFDELLRGLRGPVSGRRLALIRMAFDRLDKTGDGVVTVEDLETVYDPSMMPEVQSGRLTKGDALREFLSQWDTIDQDGIVSFEEFVDYYKNVSASIDSDDYFELMIRNAWRISGGEGQCANTANKRVLVTHADGSETIQEVEEQACLDDRGKFQRDLARNHLQANDVIAVSVNECPPVTPAPQDRAPYGISDKENRHVGDPALLARMAKQRYKPSSVNEHTSSVGKPKVPQWIKFDKMMLQFQLYSTETLHSHLGSFNPQTREFDTTLAASYTVRKFVLTYYLEDSTLAIVEPAVENGGGFGGKTFLKRTKLHRERARDESLLSGQRGDDTLYQPTDLVVGNILTIHGRKFVVYDADKNTRDFFKQYHPKLHVPPAQPLPRDPNPPKKANQDSAISRQHRVDPKDKRTMASRKFIENDGKVLVFDCVWDDPSMSGERRYCVLHYYLGDDSMEVREVNQRNSGRGRTALFNVNRQVIKKTGSHEEVLSPADLIVGKTIQVFGRRIFITGCNAFTLEYAKAFDIAQPGEAERERLRERYQVVRPQHGLAEAMGKLDIYSSPNQRNAQLFEAIRSVIERNSRYGSGQEKRRMLMTHFAKHGNKDRTINRQQFKSAMSFFSCFGMDSDRLFDAYIARDGEEKDAHEGQHAFEYERSFVNVVFPEGRQLFDADQPPNAEKAPCDPRIQRVLGSPIGGVSKEELYATHPKLESLVKAIQSKLESLTNFGDKHHHRQLILRTFRRFDADKSGEISKLEFRGALAKFNCWSEDADYLFDALDANKNGTLEYNEFVNLCV